MAQKVDLSEFYKLSKPKRPPCQVGFALGEMDETPVAQLTAACAADPAVITNIAIQEWLAARKHDVSINRVVAHRKGKCSCG